MITTQKTNFFIIATGITFVSLLGWLSISMIEKQIKYSVSESLIGTLDITRQGLLSWVEENKHTIMLLPHHLRSSR